MRAMCYPDHSKRLASHSAHARTVEEEQIFRIVGCDSNTKCTPRKSLRTVRDYKPSREILKMMYIGFFYVFSTGGGRDKKYIMQTAARAADGCFTTA